MTTGVIDRRTTWRDNNCGEQALLSETLREQVATLARALRNEAQATIDVMGKRHVEAAAQMEAERERLATALEAARTQITQLEATLNAERHEHQTTHEALTEVKAQLREQASAQAAFVQRLEEKEAMIASLEDKHRHARESLEHFRAAAQTQREQEQRQHADQLQHLRAEVRELQQTLSVKQQDLTTLNRDNARLVAELNDLQRAHRELKDAHAQAEAARAASATSNHQLESALAQKDVALGDLVAAHQTLQQQYDEARNAFAELDTRCLKLQTELEVQQRLLDTLRPIRASRSTPPSPTD